LKTHTALMTQVTRQHHGYVSPYLQLPVRTLEQAESELQADAAPSVPEPEDRPPANDRQKE